MEDYTTRTYGTNVMDNRPLFGETSARRLCQRRQHSRRDIIIPEYFVSNYAIKDRIINLIVGGLTLLLVLVTIISAFVFPNLPPKPVNIFFALCIIMTCISAVILIFWYRQGDLEPKFRNLIYYILFTIVMLCVCANLYFHDVGK